MWVPFKKKIERTMTTRIVGSIIRHLLTGMGAAGLISGDELEQVISATSIIISIIWSIIQKRSDKNA